MPQSRGMAPVESKPPGLFDTVMQLDSDKNMISIGWSLLNYEKRQTRDYPTRSQNILKGYSKKQGTYKRMVETFL